jgi:hypothetical protein
VDSNLKWEIQIRIKTRIHRKEETLLCFAGRKPPIQPIPALGPSAGPTSRPPSHHLPRTPPGHWQAGPAHRVTRPHDDARASSLTFGLWLTPKGKGGRASRRARQRGVSPPRRISSVRVSPAAQPYLSRRRAPGGSPNPSRLGGKSLPCPPTNPPEEKEK